MRTAPAKPNKPVIEPFSKNMTNWIIMWTKEAHKERYGLVKLGNQSYIPHSKTYDKDALKEDLRNVLNKVHVIVGEEPIRPDIREKVIKELFLMDERYYYNKNRKSPKNYKTEKLWDDLEFTLNHIIYD